MTLIENWRYMTDMVGGPFDYWRLTGYIGRVRKMISTPKVFDEKTRTIITKSGSLYLLGRCSANEEEHLQYIRDDIERGEPLKVK